MSREIQTNPSENSGHDTAVLTNKHTFCPATVRGDVSDPAEFMECPEYSECPLCGYCEAHCDCGRAA